MHALALPGIFDEYSNLHHRRQVEGDDAQQLATRIDVEMKYILETASFGEDMRIMLETIALFGDTAINYARQSVGMSTSRELS